MSSNSRETSKFLTHPENNKNKEEAEQEVAYFKILALHLFI